MGRIALGASADAAWVDFTPYVLQCRFRQGAERWGARVDTGTAQVTVDNTTGIFIPEAEWTPIRGFVRSVQDGGYGSSLSPTRRRVSGFLCSPAGSMLPMAIRGAGGYEITSTLSLVDFMGDWNALRPARNDSDRNQRTDLRVTAALDRYGWPAADRASQTGIPQCANVDAFRDHPRGVSDGG